MEVYKKNINKVLNNDETLINYRYASSKDGRGNICPVTVILPTLAMYAREQVNPEMYSDANVYEMAVFNMFMEILEKKISEAKDTLIERFNYICSQPATAARFMYENGTMAGYVPEEGIVSALKHGTLAIGQLGLAETLYILIGCDHTSDKGMKHAKIVEKLFKDKCAEFKEQYKLNFGVYYTPAENLCYTAFKKWKAKYGEMENVTWFTNSDGEREDKIYFTNSMHVPVWHKMSWARKMEIESELTGYSSAGCITYVEVTHEIENNIDGLERIIDYSMELDLPYVAINRDLDMCEDCGHSGYIDGPCPKCGSTHVSHLKRVTGYLTGDYIEAFNEGKVDEANDREKHFVQINFD